LFILKGVTNELSGFPEREETIGVGKGKALAV